MLKYVVILMCLCGCATNQRFDRTQLEFTFGAVAADHELASQVGVEILKQGGNAVDAAVATSFTLSVVRPESCGFGGGGFMIIDSPTMEPVALNYRETAPLEVGPDFYETHDSQKGPTAVGIPGTVAGLLEAHKKYGVLSRAEVLAPAIRIANTQSRNRQASNEKKRNKYASSGEHMRLLSKDPYSFYYGTLPFYDGTANQAGVLELISKNGRAGFYQGAVADAIITVTKGHITLEDLTSYEPRWETPLLVDIGDGNTLVAMPPPSSGGVAIAQIIGLLQRVAKDSYTKNELIYSQALVESMKHAFANRAEFLADSAFVDVPVEDLLDPEYLDALAATIRLDKTQHIKSYGSVTVPDDGGTSHFCVVDRDGMMVSATETINTEYGSRVYVTPYGFMLNNEMDDFSSPSGANVYGLRQSEKNLPEPGKRPLSSMSPTIIEQDGVPYLAIGGSGGPKIISAVVQVLLRILWFGDNPNEAVQRHRLHHQWLPNAIYYEKKNLPKHIKFHLWNMGNGGHIYNTLGVVQVILVEDGVMKPYSDRRKGGKPAGY